MKKALMWFGSGVFLWALILLALDHWPVLRNAVAVVTVAAVGVLFAAALLGGLLDRRHLVVASLVAMLLPDLARAQDGDAGPPAVVELAPTLGPVITAAPAPAAPAELAAAAPAATLDQLLTNPLGLLRAFYEACKSGQWFLAGALLLFATVGFLRVYGKKLHDKIPDDTQHWLWKPVEAVLQFFFDTRKGGWALNFLTALAACLGVPYLAGFTIDAESWRLAFEVSAGGVMLRELKKDFGLPAVTPAVALLLLLPLLALSSCSSVKGYLVSGQTLDEAGAQFEVVAPIFNRACAAEQLPIETCRGWRDFANRFKVLYRPSANAWHAAALVNEAAVERRYSDMVRPLLDQLAQFGAVLTSQGLLPGGAR